MCKMQVQVPQTESKLETGNSMQRPKGDDQPIVFTVWRKSSMGFQGTVGFSVYNNSGQLVFRVDNYSRRHKYLTKEIVLMDGHGRALLCLRPRIMSMHNRWNAYGVEECQNKQSSSKLFSMRRHSMLKKVDKADVAVTELTNNNKPKLIPGYKIEGCFEKKICRIYNNKGEEVAQFSAKTIGDTSISLGNDVFRLVIQPGFNCTMVIAFVVIMDRFH